MSTVRSTDPSRASISGGAAAPSSQPPSAPPRVATPPRPPARVQGTPAAGTPPPRQTVNLRAPTPPAVHTPPAATPAKPAAFAAPMATVIAPLPAPLPAPMPASMPLSRGAAPTPAPIAVPVPAPLIAPAAPVAATQLASSPPVGELVAIDEAEHAVEVVAMLGDSVVGVKHCATAPRRRLSAKAFFIATAVAVLVAAIAFGLSLTVAAHNHAGRLAWVGELGRPLYAFRERTLAPIYDLIGLGAVAIAIFSFAAGLWRRERTSPMFRLGTAAGVELPVAAAPEAAIAIVAEREGRLVIRTTRELGGELVSARGPVPLVELVAHGYARQSADGAIELPMPRAGQVRLRCGAATVLLSAVRRPARVVVQHSSGERRVWAFAAASALAHVAVLAISHIAPVEASIGAFDLVQAENLRTVGAAAAKEDPLPEEASGETAPGAGGPASDAMKLPSGDAGNPDAAQTNKRMATQRTEGRQISRAEAIAMARSSGLLGSSAMHDWNPIGVTGSQDISDGLDDTSIYGEIYGDQVGESFGSYNGNGRQGIGIGGDGFSDTIGSRPSYNTIGDDGLGDGTRGSCRLGAICRGVGPGGRSSLVPGVRLGPPSCGAAGCGPDKEIVRRYIKRALAKITYCYEKELLGNPELDGTVDATFVIAPNGAVMSSSANGVSGAVSQCVAGVISAISFPAMQSLVQVRYPFIFRRAG